MSSFTTSESGAVTVDWVVLTAALVGLGLATMAVVSAGVEDLSDDVQNQMSGYVIKTAFETGSTAFDTSSYDALRTTWYNDQTNIIGLAPRDEAHAIGGYENRINNVRTRIGNGEQTSAYAEIERALAYIDFANDSGYDMTSAYDNVGTLEDVLVEYETAFGCRQMSCT